jgi:hypothetical protein
LQLSILHYRIFWVIKDYNDNHNKIYWACDSEEGRKDERFELSRKRERVENEKTVESCPEELTSIKSFSNNCRKRIIFWRYLPKEENNEDMWNEQFDEYNVRGGKSNEADYIYPAHDFLNKRPKCFFCKIFVLSQVRCFRTFDKEHAHIPR